MVFTLCRSAKIRPRTHPQCHQVGTPSKVSAASMATNTAYNARRKRRRTLEPSRLSLLARVALRNAAISERITTTRTGDTEDYRMALSRARARPSALRILALSRALSRRESRADRAPLSEDY